MKFKFLNGEQVLWTIMASLAVLSIGASILAIILIIPLENSSILPGVRVLVSFMIVSVIIGYTIAMEIILAFLYALFGIREELKGIRHELIRNIAK